MFLGAHVTVFVVDGNFDNSLFAGASCSFGVFDGLHVGHRYLIEQSFTTRGDGNKVGIITFDIDPDEVFHPDRLRKIMRNADRLQALDETGVDFVACLPFVRELYSKDPEMFLNDLFEGAVPAHLHVGEDFRFGARASGTVETLQNWGDAAGCQVHPHKLVSAEGVPITATRIRLALQACDLDEAEKLLGRPYRMRETVRKGRGEGMSFGFATANLIVKTHDRVLGDGVYAAYATIDGERYKAAVSVGVSPTFEDEAKANVEAHILDFDGDLVGKEIALDFITFLRPMMKFDSTEELIATVTSNIQWVRDNL